MAPPPRPRPARQPPRPAMLVVTGLAGVVAGALVFLVVANVLGGAADESAATTFDVGVAEDRARSVARDGPLLFQDPLGRSLDIWVQHLGGGDWRAFEARAPGSPEACVLRWEPGPGVFADPCGGRTFPADGTGLASFPASVDERGHVVVDLRSPPRP